MKFFAFINLSLLLSIVVHAGENDKMRFFRDGRTICAISYGRARTGSHYTHTTAAINCWREEQHQVQVADIFDKNQFKVEETADGFIAEIAVRNRVLVWGVKRTDVYYETFVTKKVVAGRTCYFAHATASRDFSCP